MLKNLNLKLFKGLAYLFYLKYANPLFIVVVCLSGQSINASDLPLVVHSKTTEWILTDTERNRIEYRHDVLAKSYIKRLGMWNEYQRDKKLYAELENQKPSNTGQVAAQKAALLGKYSEPTQDIIKNGTYDQLEDIVSTFYDGDVDRVLKDKDEQQYFRQEIIPHVEIVSLLLKEKFGDITIDRQFDFLKKSSELRARSLMPIKFFHSVQVGDGWIDGAVKSVGENYIFCVNDVNCNGLIYDRKNKETFPLVKPFIAGCKGKYKVYLGHKDTFFCQNKSSNSFVCRTRSGCKI